MNLLKRIAQDLQWVEEFPNHPINLDHVFLATITERSIERYESKVIILANSLDQAKAELDKIIVWLSKESGFDARTRNGFQLKPFEELDEDDMDLVRGCITSSSNCKVLRRDSHLFLEEEM